MVDRSLLVVHGAVSTVKAIASREISVVFVEIPIESHVAATNLLFDKDALVARNRLQASLPFGVLNPASMHTAAAEENDASSSSEAPSPLGESATLAHGHVTEVRPLPSRGVSVIKIELPEEAHVAVTELLYGQNALILPANLRQPNSEATPYGLVQSSGQGTVHKPNPRAPSSPLSSSKPQSAFAGLSRRATSSSMFHIPTPQLHIVRWLGIRCAESDFQDFLGVRNEGRARERVCELCGVESRRDIPQSPESVKNFMDKIYRPFNELKGSTG